MYYAKHNKDTVMSDVIPKELNQRGTELDINNQITMNISTEM